MESITAPATNMIRKTGQLFEPFQIHVTEDAMAIALNDPDLLRACEILGLLIVS